MIPVFRTVIMLGSLLIACSDLHLLGFYRLYKSLTSRRSSEVSQAWFGGLCFMVGRVKPHNAKAQLGPKNPHALVLGPKTLKHDSLEP